MIRLREEHIQGYIDYFPPLLETGSKILWNMIFVDMVITILVALLGFDHHVVAYREINLSLLALLAFFVAWSCYLSFHFADKQEGVALFLGCNFFFISLLCLLFAYYLFMAVMPVPIGMIISVVSLYCIAVILTIVVLYVCINRGCFSRATPWGLLFMGAFTPLVILVVLIGRGIAKASKEAYTTNESNHMVAFVFLLCAFGFMIGGPMYVMKYYCHRKIHRCTGITKLSPKRNTSKGKSGHLQ